MGRPERLPSTTIGRAGLSRALRLTANVLLFSLLPLFVLALVVIWASAFDFQVFWQAGQAAWHGRSPYPPLTTSALKTEHVFVYPPVAAFAFIPFALIPFQVAAVLFDLVLAAAVVLTLRLAGVRDWRCYGLVFASTPLFNALGVGALSPLLALGVALAWRYRDRAVVCGLAVAAVVALKVFLWPLVLWLLLTRRPRAAAVAVATSAGAVLVSWAALGFAGLADYPRLLFRLGDTVGWKSYSLSALGLDLGASPLEAKLAAWAACGLALALAARYARQGRELDAFAATLAGAFLFSPIIWPHYLVILFVPLAARRPRLSWPWLLPLALWPSPAQAYGVAWAAALGLALTLALAAGGPTPRWLSRAPLPLRSLLRRA